MFKKDNELMSQRLLILHGWGSNSSRWQKIKEILEDKGIEVLIPDMPGFGRTPAPKEAWGVEDYQKWVLDFAKGKGWEKFNLFGHSFGGAISVKIASENPEKIEKLILCAISAIREKKKSKKVKVFGALAKIGKAIFSLPILNIFYNFARKNLYRLSGSGDYYLASGVMKETFRKVITENLQNNLKYIKSKTLILWGEKDEAVPLKHAYILNKEINDSQLIVFQGARHALNFQIPQKLAENIIKFLKS